MKTRRQRREAAAESGGLALYLLTAIVLSALFIAPLVWAVLRSFQPAELIGSPITSKNLTQLTLGNYSGLVTGPPNILRHVGNSLIVAAATAALTALIATLAGYAFGRPRLRYRGAGVMFSLILLTLMIPFQAILTPLFLELHALDLTNSLLGLILFYTTYNLPFGVFVMRNTFTHIPREMEDSAAVDGAGVMRTLVSVLRPLVVPGMATTVLYAFLFAWTEFLGALIFLTSDSKLTLPVALLDVESGTYGSVNFGFLIAGAVIAMVPCVVLYITLQRYYIRGLMSGAVKG